jgi:hypothetical protein
MSHKQRTGLCFALAALSLSSCSGGVSSLNGYFVSPDAPTGAITTVDDKPALKSGDAYLTFVKNENDLYQIEIRDNSTHDLIAYNDEPARISVRGAESFGMYETHDYAKGYDAVTQTNYGYHCVAILNTSAKSQFRLMDSYYLTNEYGITVNRKVTVLKAKTRDAGFESLFTLKNGAGSTAVNDFDFFIPSTVYKDTKYNASSALVTNLGNPQVYVKETRMGLPMTMIRNKKTSYYFSLVHAEPNITVNGVEGGGADGEVNDDLEYGSLGFESERDGKEVDVALTFCYPCAEGPATFDNGGWARRFHEVSEKHFHEYKVGLVSGKTSDFNDALVDSYEKSYLYVDATCEQASNEKAYQQNIDCFSSEYKEFKNGSCGVPWELNLNPQKAKGTYSFQMGFVGQQTSVGAHLYRQGLLKNNSTYITQGKNIVNFWTSKTIYPDDSVFPYIWYEGSGGYLHSTGKMKYAAIYLRMLCDGVEGILDAYLYGKENGKNNSDWLDYCIRFADNLVAKQNEDGSFNRAFTKDGGVPGDDFSDSNIGNDSNDPAKFKINTPVAIRFLAKMYETTEKESYKKSALDAAEYSYAHIYKEMGKYVGGTCDNANVVDKEAAIYAMFGFRYAYVLSGDSRYEKAMRHAACCALSWTFMYDYACPASEEYAAYCPYVDGHVLGASIIATGHAGADCFACYMWYDIFKVYELTGNIAYKKAAITLQNASKLLSDYDGSRGWRYPCLMAEACQVSDFLYHPTNQNGTLWLPWCGVAQINPIVYTYQDYGVYQLEDVKLSGVPSGEAS